MAFDQAKTSSFLFKKASEALLNFITAPFSGLVGFLSDTPKEMVSFLDFLKEAFGFKNAALENKLKETADGMQKLSGAAAGHQVGMTDEIKRRIADAARAAGIQIAPESPPAAVITPPGAQAPAAAAAK